jgi:hypothetical protein
MKMREFLNAAEIPFEQISIYDFDHYKEEWPGWIEYRGALFTDFNYAFVAKVTKESLFKAAEDMYFMRLEDVKKCGEAQRDRKE